MRAVSPRGLAGPIGIIQLMSYSARVGVRQFLYVLALISVNLAVLNLLPIPVLDGGHILTAIVEGVRGKPLGTKTLSIVQNIFVVLLVGLMILVMANDVLRNWGGAISNLFSGRAEVAPAPGPDKKP